MPLRFRQSTNCGAIYHRPFLNASRRGQERCGSSDPLKSPAQLPSPQKHRNLWNRRPRPPAGWSRRHRWSGSWSHIQCPYTARQGQGQKGVERQRRPPDRLSHEVRSIVAAGGCSCRFCGHGRPTRHTGCQTHPLSSACPRANLHAPQRNSQVRSALPYSTSLCCGRTIGLFCCLKLL